MITKKFRGISYPALRRRLGAGCSEVFSRRKAGWIFLLFVFLGLCLAGCPRPRQPETTSDTTSAEQTATLHRDELFEIAIANLNRLHQFDGTDMALQVADRLDQWIKTQPPLKEWEVDPLIKTLPEGFVNAELLQDLEKLSLDREDGLFLQSAVWLRDIAAWARGEDPSELARACRLFDWVVLNIQLDSQDQARQLPSGDLLVQKPWETLLLGHGSAIDRAWVYVLLCRQEGLDAAVLSVNRAPAGAEPRWDMWAVGVLINGKIYVFEPALGMPIPARDGVQVVDGEGLVITPATVDELAVDDSLLRRMDADPRNPYPVRASQLEQVMVYVEGSAPYLSRRMEMIQRMLSGEESLVISAHPSDLAMRFRGLAHVRDVQLWALPYLVEKQRKEFESVVGRYLLNQITPFMLTSETGIMPLWRGRILHLRGNLVGEEGAAHYYQLARPPERLIDSGQLAADEQRMYTIAKLNASYWLGLIAVDQGNRKSAEDYLINRTAMVLPDQPWHSGVLYALGRLNEKLGDYSQAITTYRSEFQLPNRFGNLVRARLIEELTGAKPLEISPEPTTNKADKASQPDKTSGKQE